ncbi:hypothetical protein L6452_19350 [Arctium lappa]|uniref:Uncharacterized protein n=1 Tax=Arctium lappa TaxID=4217 RepID=A0ACB9B8B8_ARCLA|nr:hypothetical protein L6452_19350 [Arctium lappa]
MLIHLHERNTELSEKDPGVVHRKEFHVGIETPKIEVRYENLSVEGKAYVGDRALPSLYNAILNSIESTLQLIGLCPSKKRKVKILQSIIGVSNHQDRTVAFTDEYDGQVREIRFRSLCNSPMCLPDTTMMEWQHAQLSSDKRSLSAIPDDDGPQLDRVHLRKHVSLWIPIPDLIAALYKLLPPKAMKEIT